MALLLFLIAEMRLIKTVGKNGPLMIHGVHKIEFKLRERKGGTGMARGYEILVNLFQNCRFYRFYEEFII